MLSQCWEEGLTCRGCGGLIPLGGDMLYGKHLGCARGAAQDRRSAAGEAQDVVEVARERLAAKGRIILTGRQLRELVARSGVDPVRRPDRAEGKGPNGWYSRLAGWRHERVEAGLSAAEAAGLWLDHIDVGRQPPIRHQDLEAVLGAIYGRCLQPCDPDCGGGPVHCEWIHLPSHKPGWHSQDDCPAVTAP